jgi:hypothetical protein
MSDWLRVFARAVAVTVILALVLLGLSCTGFLPWSRLNCWSYDVDINSGRIRYTRHFFYAQVRQRIEDSALSRALQPQDHGPHIPQWQRVYTFSPGVGHSPHHLYHSAIHQIGRMEKAWTLGRFSAAARRASAQRILERWQSANGDDTAQTYLCAIEELAFREESEPIDVNDLPVP